MIIPFFRGDERLRPHILGAATLHLPQTALGELYCGANLSTNPLKTLGQIDRFLTAVILVCPGFVTAQVYGRVRAQLAKNGTPIPENDIWIAALALEHQLPLAARDAHFDQIHGLTVLKW